jgi:hypothetical protein
MAMWRVSALLKRTLRGHPIAPRRTCLADAKDDDDGDGGV